MKDLISLKCIECGKDHEPTKIWRCECSGLLEVTIHEASVSRKEFDERAKKFPCESGVWRYVELVHPLIERNKIITRPEGNTNIYYHKKICEYADAQVYLKHEGENPTGSFKDRGMTVGISEANRLGVDTVACASTGNTSASLASYAALAFIKSVVFIPAGQIAVGKLAQAIAYGSQINQVQGNFDIALDEVQKTGVYLLNSINPWRIEGQKTIAFELIQQFNWQPPDWIVVPAGNLGNTTAIGKALLELKKFGIIEKIPKIASIQAQGASPFYFAWKNKRDLIPEQNPHTIASAIKIGNPVSWKKALKAIKQTRGIVESVTDQEIMDAKAVIDSSGIGCEPASAATLAGVKKLREKNEIKKDEKIACILTGNLLKDPDATIKYHENELKQASQKL